MSAREVKLIEELRGKELKALTDSEFTAVKNEVETKGIRGLKGSTAQIVFAALRKRDEAMNKARAVAVGDMVSWSSSGGTARGKVEHIMREGVLGIPKSDFSIKAEKDDPAVLIRIYKDDKETETLVGHKMSTLRKNFEKHYSHDQKTHGGKYNTDDSEGEDSSEPKNYKGKKPKISYEENDTEGEFDNNADDPKWMDDMDILRPPKRK